VGTAARNELQSLFGETVADGSLFGTALPFRLGACTEHRWAR